LAALVWLAAALFLPAALFVALIPLVLLMKRPRRGGPAPAAH